MLVSGPAVVTRWPIPPRALSVPDGPPRRPQWTPGHISSARDLKQRKCIRSGMSLQQKSANRRAQGHLTEPPLMRHHSTCRGARAACKLQPAPAPYQARRNLECAHKARQEGNFGVPIGCCHGTGLLAVACRAEGRLEHGDAAFRVHKALWSHRAEECAVFLCAPAAARVARPPWRIQPLRGSN